MSMVAILASPVFHEPPSTSSARPTVVSGQISKVPVMASGSGFTTTSVVIEQPMADV